MSDTNEAPQNLPVGSAFADEKPKNEESLDGSAPAVVVKQDGSEIRGVASMEIDDKAIDESGDGGKICAEAVRIENIGKGSVDNAEGSVQDVGNAEKEVKPQLSSGTESVNVGSIPDGNVAINESAAVQSFPDETVVANESAAVKSVSNEKAAQNESAAVQSVPDEMVVENESADAKSILDENVAQTESAAVQSVPDEAVVKNNVAASETLVEAVEPASDNVTVTPGSEMAVETAETTADTKAEVLAVSEIKADADEDVVRDGHAVVCAGSSEVKAASGELGEDVKNQVTATGEKLETGEHGMIMSTPVNNGQSLSRMSFPWDGDEDGSDSGTEVEQAAFMKELENFFRGRSVDFKPPKFYGEGLNCLKLWRGVMRLGGYDKVTSCKLWRQVGESFRPPKTCTTVSWTFRGFYEKALLDYERHKVHGGEVTLPIASQSEPSVELQGSGSGRARRDAAARAMQGWHQRLHGNGEVSDPIIKDKTPVSLQRREKQLGNIGLLKRKKPSYADTDVKLPRIKAPQTQLDITPVDLGPPADWVKINVHRTKDCFEVYALVPGLLREEVRVQSDPAGRLVISGEPEHPDSPWGVTPFKKMISLPSRINPHQTSAVVTLHGQLFVRVPFELSE